MTTSRAPFLQTAVRTISRFGWGFSDQALSSLTNFMLSLLAARSLGTADLGSFGIAFVLYLVSLGVARALATEPLVVRFADRSVDEWRAATSAATGAVLVLAIVMGLGFLIVGLFVRGVLADSLKVLSVMLPGLLLQDCWRYAFFAAGRGRSAFYNDLVWAVFLIPWAIGLVVSDRASVAAFVFAWGVSGTLAAGFGLIQARLVPTMTECKRWLLANGDLGFKYLAEFGIGSGVTQLSTMLVGVVASLRDVGAVRAGQILLGPLNVLFLASGLAAIPEGVKLAKRALFRMKSFCLVASVVLAGAAAGWGAFLLLLPDSVGRALIHENWGVAQPVIVPLTLSMIGFGFTTGAGIGVRSLAAADYGLRAKIIVAPWTILFVAGGAGMFGSVGAAWGLALMQALAAFVWWRQLAKAIKARAANEQD